MDNFVWLLAGGRKKYSSIKTTPGPGSLVVNGAKKRKKNWLAKRAQSGIGEEKGRYRSLLIPVPGSRPNFPHNSPARSLVPGYIKTPENLKQD